MSELYTIIPAAGVSKRFKEAGYETPKPLLYVKSKDGTIASMVAHVVDSAPFENCLIGLPIGQKQPDDLTGAAVGIKSTTGQADTIYQIVRMLDDDSSILVLDCDMVLLTKDIDKLVEMIKVYDVAIAVTETFDPNSSRVDQVPFPTKFVEKEPISQWGIVGARAFKNAGLLTDALRKTLEWAKALNVEPYLSHAINLYPGTKYAHVITEYQDWGTPERLQQSGAVIV